MNLQTFLKKQDAFWVLVVGVVLIIFGIYTLIDIHTLEASGQDVRMIREMEFIYRFGGKYAVFALIELAGCIALIAGISMHRTRR